MLRVTCVLIAAAALTLCVAACADNQPAAAAAKPRKVYYAHDVSIGSHLPRAYVDSTPPPDDPNIPGSNMAGQRAFVNNTGRGNGPAGGQ